jgi:DNA-binding XRE family transcriptional regulator
MRRKNEGDPLGGRRSELLSASGRVALRAEQRGQQLAQLRKNTGLTQAQIAATMGVSRARVSQIEHGRVTELDAIREYVEALGGTVDVVARVGDWTVRVA